MQDAFPIEFEFKQGEQPTAAKFNGLVKFTDTAFSRVSQAVGDPWDSTSHVKGTLSPEKLAQTSLARIIGPADYISPLGGCWNEQMTTTVTVTLSEDKNSWTLGYPLVKVLSTITEATNSVTSFVTKLTWGAANDIEVTTDTDGVLSTEKTSIEEVVTDGDFYVDYYTGTITAYSSSSATITLTISDLYMLGAGVPWGTHNVIPTWEETAALCNLGSKINPGDGTSRYTLTLPTVTYSPRYQSATIRTGKKSVSVSDYDSVWGSGASNQSSYYRVPQTLVNDYSAGDTIPEGYILLYSELQGRVLPSATYTLYYRDENSLTVITAEDALTVGSNYRIFTSGTSLSEAVSYLLQVQRNNNHVGLTANPTLSYTMPLSHDSMDNLYSGDLDASAADVYRLKFTKSNYETNCHPQYLHRYGWMENDVPSTVSQKGNSGNAMRGHLVFSGSDSNMYVGTATESGNYTATYGVMWGGGSQDSTAGNTKLAFEGGAGISTWTSGNPPDRFLFVSTITGGGAIDTYGALTYTPWYGTPLYLRGVDSSDARDGAMLGFDLQRQGEFNYIKLFEGYRTTYDPAHQPAQISQSSFSTSLYITPSLSNRLAAEQVREFRFRGIPYLSSATNTGDSIYGTSYVSEYKHSFVSPGMVGADFFNVYSNAIFFSDDGDGTKTSFTEHGKNWLDTGTGTYMPSGIYYIPHDGATEARFSFVTQEDSTTASGDDILRFGGAYGLRYYGERLDLITRDTTTYAGNSVNIDSSIDSILRNAFYSTYFNYESIILDATENKNLGILSYDGRVDIWAFNSYHSSNPSSSARHINIKTSCSTTNLTGTQDIGNITLHAGATLIPFGPVPSSTGSILYLKAYNNVEIESEATDVNITSTLGDINIDAADDTYINSSDFTKITTDGSSGKIEISTASTNASSESGDISIKATGSQGRIYLSSASLHNIDVSSNNALTMRAYSYIALSTNASESHITNASNYNNDSITLSSRSNKTNIHTGRVLLDSIEDVEINADDDVTIQATDRLYMQANEFFAEGLKDQTGAGSGAVRLDASTHELLYLASSIRYKENVKDLSDSSWIYNLRPVSFNYIREGKPCYGFIAEEVIQHNTDVVCLDKQGRPESVMYESIFTALLNEVKKQREEIDTLKAQLIGK